MGELVAEKEREIMLQEQKEKDYYADLQRAVEVAKFNLQRHLGMGLSSYMIKLDHFLILRNPFLLDVFDEESR